MNLRNTLFCTNIPLWVGISWKAYGLRQVNRQRLEEICMLPCHNCYVCGTWRSKEVGGINLSYGGKRKRHNKRNFYGTP